MCFLTLYVSIVVELYQWNMSVVFTYNDYIYKYIYFWRFLGSRYFDRLVSADTNKRIKKAILKLF